MLEVECECCEELLEIILLGISNDIGDVYWEI